MSRDKGLLDGDCDVHYIQEWIYDYKTLKKRLKLLIVRLHGACIQATEYGWLIHFPRQALSWMLHNEMSINTECSSYDKSKLLAVISLYSPEIPNEMTCSSEVLR